MKNESMHKRLDEIRNIAEVNETFEALGYRKLRSRSDIIESLYQWCEKHAWGAGMPGPDYQSWGSNDLYDLTLGYLKSGSGKRFWPSKEYKAIKFVPEYPTNEET